MKKLSIFVMLAAVCFFPAAAGNHSNDLTAIKAKKIVTVSGKPIDNGILLIRGDKILEVGSGIPVPPGCKIYDYPDSVVYPGLINPVTSLGISGIARQSEWNDIREVGKFNPQVSVFTAFYPWGNLIANTRDFGTLTALSAPSGGLIAGKAALVNLDGWTPEDMFLKKEAAMIMRVPEMPWWLSEEKKKPLKERIDKEKKELREFISRAHAYYLRSGSGALNLSDRSDRSDPERFDSKFEAMNALWEKQLPVFIGANDEENIRYAIQLGKEFKLNVVLLEVYEGEKVLKEIKASGYPVILDSMYGTNRKWEDGCDKVFRLPALLAREGIPFAFSHNWAATAFDLPLHAGRAAAYGLSQEEALKGLTLYPAKILGIEDYGSIEKGKIANLVVASGNILEPSTIIEDVFVKGKRITARSFFQREYERAKDKISGESE
jgi:imidazolonepropionase-like amidohydrolase